MSKRTETIEITVTYCDYCGKKLKYGHASITFSNGETKDFCNEYTSKIDKTCLDKYKEDFRNQLEGKSK